MMSPRLRKIGADLPSFFLPKPTPAGVPVATVGIGNAKNAAILAARILGISDEAISRKVADGLKEINQQAKDKGASLSSRRAHKTGF